MTTEERRFQRVLGSLNTRESSTLVIATVASSASLVLLGFPSQTTIPEQVSFTWVGFLFPILGEVYRELTIFTVDAKDLDELFQYTGGAPEGFGAWSWWAFLRRTGLRLLLLIPSGLWLVNRLWPLTYNVEGPNFLLVTYVLVGACVEFSVFEQIRNVRLSYKRRRADCQAMP